MAIWMVKAQLDCHQTTKNASSNDCFPEFLKDNIFAKKQIIVSLKKLKLTNVPPPAPAWAPKKHFE